VKAPEQVRILSSGCRGGKWGRAVFVIRDLPCLLERSSMSSYEDKKLHPLSSNEDRSCRFDLVVKLALFLVQIADPAELRSRC
jgi:hypothetical protein